MKDCSKCQKSKRLSSYYKRKSGPRAGEYYEKCKECMRKRGVQYYHLNHERQLTLALIRKKKSYYKKRDLINKLKEVPCTDCHKKYPYYVMDFDHKDSNDKIGDISHMISMSEKNLMNEVSKCEIVCANCHRIRTFGKHMPS